MENYEKIPLQVFSYPALLDEHPQMFLVRKGWEFRFAWTRGYQRNQYSDWEVELCRAGDWVEIVNPDQTERILYELY